jgi:N6-L-threonylcarbamoyladenine synthase
MAKPIVGVNHLEGHIAANWLKPIRGITKSQIPISKKNPKSQILNSKKVLSFTFQVSRLFPAICLIVSGGHTQLVLMENLGKYKVIGQTRDDAAGEAFDKVAKMLGLGYPGGPEIALKAKNSDSKAFKLPRPMISSNDFDFSFSGLKTAVLYLLKTPVYRRDIKKQASQGHFCERSAKGGTPPAPQIAKMSLACLSSNYINNLCASFQQAVIDVLIDKTIKAAREYKVKTIMLAGGVAANKELQKQMAHAAKTSNFQFLIPNLKYCADNAAMIGLAGYWKYTRQGKGDKINKIIAAANLNF